jgi:hypothetical protein
MLGVADWIAVVVGELSYSLIVTVVGKVPVKFLMFCNQINSSVAVNVEFGLR